MLTVMTTKNDKTLVERVDVVEIICDSAWVQFNEESFTKHMNWVAKTMSETEANKNK